jgi:hypothetical protein
MVDVVDKNPPLVEVREVLFLEDVQYHYDTKTGERLARVFFETAKSVGSADGPVPSIRIQATFTNAEVDKLKLSKYATLVLYAGDQITNPVKPPAPTPTPPPPAPTPAPPAPAPAAGTAVACSGAVVGTPVAQVQ